MKDFLPKSYTTSWEGSLPKSFSSLPASPTRQEAGRQGVRKKTKTKKQGKKKKKLRNILKVTLGTQPH